ncbi:MAG: type II toxin-antitoxin system VapC family toxin [Anaerolineae bacterium]
MIILDTNICIYVIKRRPMSVLTRFENVPNGELGISVITYAELQFGVEKSSAKKQNQIVLDEFVDRLEVLDWDRAAANEYAILRTRLQKQGLMIGPLDLQIAAHAKSRGDVLVTNNLREFNRVPALKLENWV